MKTKKPKLIGKVTSIADLFNRAATDPQYAQLAMISAANLGGNCKDLASARQWLNCNAMESGSEQGVVDEINFCRDLVK